MSRVPRVGAWLTPPLVLLVAACTTTDVTPSAQDEPAPFADCTSLTAPLAPAVAQHSLPPGSPAPAPPPAPPVRSSAVPPSSPAGPAPSSAAPAPSLAGLASAGLASSSPSPSSSAPDLPDISLPCFTGGAAVSTSDLRGPAVINLWGSWCGPCREELPVMQELADATKGQLRVLGVDTRDSRDAGASFAADHDVTMPTLYDPEQKLLAGLGKATLPVTVFLDAGGRRFVYSGVALDKPALGALVRTHTGVTVAG